MLVLMTGSAIAQVLGFALTPIISRLYSEADFGEFSSFNNVLSIIGAGVCLDYTQALMLPKEKDKALNVFVLSCLLSGLCVVGVLIFWFAVPGFLQRKIHVESMWMLPLLLVAVLITGINHACQAWCVRNKEFSTTSSSQVIRSVANNSAQIGLGLNGGALPLIAGSVLADFLATINLARVAWRDLVALRREIRWERIWQLAKDYRDFPLYSASRNVINALSSGLPVFLLTQYYGIAVAGAYAFGQRLLWVPMGFVTGALRQVLFQKACETHNHGGRLLPLYLKTTVGLLALIIVPSAVTIFWAPQIFAWVFGAKWLVAGEYARSLILWLMVAFCNLPAILFARLIRIQRPVFFYELVLLAARAGTLYYGGIYQVSAGRTIWLFSLVGAIMNAVLIVMVGYALYKREGSPDIHFDLKTNE